MIRLNDIDKTVIDEKEIKRYYGFNDILKTEQDEAIELFLTHNRFAIFYDTKELRDKDIELLDKLFDVNTIEEKVKNINREQDKDNLIRLVVNEEYLTWKDVQKYATKLKVELPNKMKIRIMYISVEDYIELYSPISEITYGEIYDEDLFNSLMLKKVD